MNLSFGHYGERPNLGTGSQITVQNSTSARVKAPCPPVRNLMRGGWRQLTDKEDRSTISTLRFEGLTYGLI